MKPYQFEQIFPNAKSNESAEILTESGAEKQLEDLLQDPQNAFLLENKKNRETIENAETASSALGFARRRIRERLIATLHAKEVHGGHSEQIRVNPDSVLNALEHIRRHALKIGEGADGEVVVDLSDEVNVNPEICYKFSFVEKLRRGRNSVSEEAELQGAFYEAALKLSNRDIQVPMPYYEIEVFTTQIIAMEKLHARSVD